MSKWYPKLAVIFLLSIASVGQAAQEPMVSMSAEEFTRMCTRPDLIQAAVERNLKKLYKESLWNILGESNLTDAIKKSFEMGSLASLQFLGIEVAEPTYDEGGLLFAFYAKYQNPSGRKFGVLVQPKKAPSVVRPEYGIPQSSQDWRISKDSKQSAIDDASFCDLKAKSVSWSMF